MVVCLAGSIMIASCDDVLGDDPEEKLRLKQEILMATSKVLPAAGIIYLTKKCKGEWARYPSIHQWNIVIEFVVHLHYQFVRLWRWEQ